jgi:predicted phosphodiesterase
MVVSVWKLAAVLATLNVLQSARGFVRLAPSYKEQHCFPSTTLLAAASDATQTVAYHCLPNVKRIFCISDLHTDHAENQQWLRDRMAQDTWSEQDLLVVAGDISHDMATLERSLLSMKKANCHVLFVCGNHEAWIHKKDETLTSLQKLTLVRDVCRNHGVLVDPCLVQGDHPLWILPFQSWYDGSLSFNETFCQGFEHWPWVDFVKCKWPFPALPTGTNARIPTGLVEYFLQQNEASFSLLKEHDACMTVSHFLPNQQSLPDWKDVDSNEFLVDEWLDHGAAEMSAKFAKVAGSNRIDMQLRSLKAKRQIHVFGHSHRPKDFEYKNIRYIHNPLGKPRERQLHLVNPNVDFQLVWDTRHGEVIGKRIVRYWEEYGGGVETLHKRLKQIKQPGRYQQLQ